jgi:hypothetical protein
MTSSVHREAPIARLRLAQAGERVDQLRRRWAAGDRAMGKLSRSLVAARASIERITRGRLAGVVRGAGLLSRTAQLAWLWR